MILTHFQTATKLDESSVVALSGIIACQIHDGQYAVAKEQLDFLKEIQSTLNITSTTPSTGAAALGNKSEILYMSALLGRLTGAPSDEVLNLLNEAVETHFKSVSAKKIKIEPTLTVVPADVARSLEQSQSFLLVSRCVGSILELIT